MPKLEEVYNVHYHFLGMGQRFFTMPEITRSMDQFIYVSQLSLLYLSSFPMDYDLTTQGHYLLLSQALPTLWRPLHSG